MKKTLHYEIWQNFDELEKADSKRNYICFYGTSNVTNKPMITAIDNNQLNQITPAQYLGVLLTIRDNLKRGILNGDIEIDS